ncbi:ABC transporter substrate-binding protein [Pseudohoeflea coraliihabitans]|uniref:Thiamine pyrimidine synthase n=1 Tax=Pseudohoeflea coraliihabitans TaxID=2860393 RepID=A0ABS6WJS0_9HYPH|nr:ABC transporter substrate-binding protein [Pseudohoeflea sp. DP4N28-3]MBW3096191.1 ABC transporter substrate-binding protein [Pseudohoeflea sp. DP4N28-3]
MKFAVDRRRFLTLAAAAAAMPMAARHGAAAEPFNFQASWINDAEFTGYFIALDKGYYAEEGLDVTYFSGGPDVIPESTLIAGKADLTLTTPDTTIKAIADQGAPFRIIGAQYQKNPIGIVSLASNPINSPEDLVGKTLAVPPVNIISVEAMLKTSGVDRSKINIVPYAYDPTPLIKGEIDASVDFTTNVPYTIEQAGAEAVSFLLYDFGFTIFNDTVVVTEDALKNNRKNITGFLRASRKGWNDNFEDPSVWPPKFADSWFKGTGRSIENELYFNRAQQPLMEHPDGIFAMSEESIEANIEALNAVGIAAKREHFDTSVLEDIG